MTGFRKANSQSKNILIISVSYNFLRLLYDHKGEAVTRDALLDTCWGRDYFPDSRTLDQHIFLLRKKVEADPANPTLIQSVRAVGYRYAPYPDSD